MFHDDVISQMDEISRNRCQNRYADMMMFNLCSGGSAISGDNEIEVFIDGKKKFEDMMKEMIKAKEYIHLQYYIIKEDGIFHNIVELLREKSRQGVEVRVLFDGIGGRGISAGTILRMRRDGIKTGIFYPFLCGCINLHVNHRNHRKVAVIDETGYIGGFNIGDEYLGYDKRFGAWRDTHFKITGGAVRDLQAAFSEDWKTAVGEDITKEEKYFNVHKKSKGNLKVQIIKSDYRSKVHIIRDNYLKMIYQAKKNVYIQTPYFVPDEPMMEAVKAAALSGVEVKLMVPAMPDHDCVYWTTGCYVGKILDAGVKVYRYMGGFLHAKGLMADGNICTFGTANTDIRSFRLNHEINAVIYDREFTVKMEDIFLDDLNKSEEVSGYMYRCRGIAPRLKGLLYRPGAKFM